MINLWINSETNALLPNWNAFGTTTLPQIKQGDTIAFDIHWVKSDPAGQFMEEVIMPPSSVIKVAVGTPNGGPTGGYFTYSFGGDSVQIPYNASGTDANTLINGLPSIVSAGGVLVTLVNQRTFRIVFNLVGPRAISSCDSTSLSPSTSISVIRINAGSPTTKEVHHLRPKLLPVAYSDSFTNSPEPTISITDIDSITKRVSISPSPKFGTFTISNGTGTTSALSINSSAGDVLNALTSAGISSSTRTYSVAKSGDYSWDIYRTSGTQETLTLTTTGLVGFSSKTGTVEFNTLEVEDLLAGQPSVSATLEVEYSYGDIRQTLYQGKITIVNDIIDEATYNPVPFPELQAGIEEAPQDGVLYGRKDGIWSAVVGDGNNIPDYDNSLIYTVGNQVYYQGKLYRMIVSVGGAGYDPVGYPSYWESLSGSNPDLSGYVEKTGAVMSLGATLNFQNTFSELSIGAGGVGVYSNTNPESVLLFENRLEVSNGTSTTKVIPAGITFPDLTTQTTAATTQDLSGYALLSGATFTGKVVGTPSASSASFNVGTVSVAPTSLSNGDIWITERLHWQNRFGNIITALTNNQTNTIATSSATSFILGVTQNGNGGGLKVTNNGTGESLRVEDGSENPDLTPFIVGSDGRVSIHGLPNANTNHKLTIHNGNIAFSQGYGLVFGDGTTLTSASGLGIQNFFNLQGVSIADEQPYDARNGSFLRIYRAEENSTPFVTSQPAYWWNFPKNGEAMPNAILQGNYSYNDGLGNSVFGTVTVTVSFSKYIPRLNTGTIGLTLGGSLSHYWSISNKFYNEGSEYYGDQLNLTTPDVELVGWSYNDTSEGISASVSFSEEGREGSPPSVTWGMVSMGTLGTSYDFTQTEADDKDQPVMKRGLIQSLIQELVGEKSFSFPIESGSENLKYLLRWDAGTNGFKFENFNNLTGDFAKLNVAQTFTESQTFTQPQFVSTNSTSAALRVTQNGTGACLLVEDVTSDTSLFVVHSDGRVGVNINQTQSFVTGSVFQVQGRASIIGDGGTRAPINITVTSANPTSTQTGDIWINNSTRNLSFNTSSTNYSVPNLNSANTFTASATGTSGYLIRIAQTEATTGGTLEVTNIQTANTGTNALFSYGGQGSNVVIRSTNATNETALRVEQRGSGNALVIEDSLNPDTSSTVINSSGNVGIGVNPSTWVSTEKLEINGNIKFSDTTVQSTAYIPSAVAITGGTINNVIIDGGTF